MWFCASEVRSRSNPRCKNMAILDETVIHGWLTGMSLSPRNYGDTLSSRHCCCCCCQRFHNVRHTTFAKQQQQHLQQRLHNNNNSNNGFTKKICHKTSTLAKIATSPFELHYSYSDRLVNMRVSWIMNMPTCDARAYTIYVYVYNICIRTPYNTYTIYVPGIRPLGSSSARLAAQHWLLGHSLLDLVYGIQFVGLCPASNWIFAERATPSLRSTQWSVSRLLDLQYKQIHTNTNKYRQI